MDCLKIVIWAEEPDIDRIQDESHSQDGPGFVHGSRVEKREGLDQDTGEMVGFGDRLIESSLEGDQEQRVVLSTFIYRDFYIWIKQEIPKKFGFAFFQIFKMAIALIILI